MTPPHPLITLLRVWADGLAPASVVAQRLAGLPGLDTSERALGLALLACGEEQVSASAARQLILALAAQPDWFDRYAAALAQARPVLNQQLGIVLTKAAAQLQQDPQAALQLYSLAIARLPAGAAAWFFRGLLRQRLGQLQAAAADLQQACRLQPDWPAAWIETAHTLMLTGNVSAALAWNEQGLRQLPQQPALWLTQGNLLQASGRLEAAAKAYRHALELDPQQAGVWSNLGLVSQQLLQPEIARECYRRALALDARLAEIWNNLATLQLDSGEAEQAEASLMRCLQLAPGYYPAWVNRALVAAGQGRSEQALQLLEQARRLEPGRTEAWLEAAGLLFEQAADQAAFELLEAGCARAEQPARLRMVQGRNLVLRHQFSAGAALMRQALALEDRPFWRFLADVGSPEEALGKPEAERRAWIAALEARLETWSRRPFAPQVYLQESGSLLIQSLWTLAYLDTRPHPRLKQLYAQCFALAAPAPPRRTHPGPLRLGVLVTPGHEGIYAKLGAGLIAALDSERVEVLLLGDAERLPGARPLAPKVAAAAAQIRALELDLLYYWEIGSDMLNFFLPYFQPAPIQFTSWGTPGSTGHPALQYYLSSHRLEAPDAATHYSEQLMLIEELPTYFPDPALAAGSADRLGLGLPAEGTLYLSLNNPIKLTPEYIDLLARILAADSSGQLILLGSRQPWIEQALRPALSRLDPFTGRVHWRPAPLARPEFLNLMALADLGLDTLDCSGGQTSHEAMALGLPVITLPGTAAHSRLTLSRWRQLGLDDGIASDTDDYVAKALELAHNPDRLAQLRARLLERRSRLLYRQEAVDQFTAALEQMAKG